MLFVDSLREQAVGMNIATYAVNYDAGKLQLGSGDGAKDAISHIKSTAASCPDTMIVLGGYSQGANVVNIVAGNPIVGIAWGAALPSSLAGNVAAIATFGNVANRAGTKLPSATALFAGKGIDLCNPADPICHAGPGNAWSGHTTGYVPDYATQAAAFVAAGWPGPARCCPVSARRRATGSFRGTHHRHRDQTTCRLDMRRSRRHTIRRCRGTTHPLWWASP